MSKNTLRVHFDKYPEEFKKIGFIFFSSIRIESSLNLLIESFFCELNQTKHLIFNQALLNEKIFPTLENKRRFLLTIIDILAEEAKKNKLPFEEKEWLKVCKAIKKIQETRNILAHKFFNFSGSNTVDYFSLRKSAQVGKPLPFDMKKIKLDDEVKEVEQVFTDIWKMIINFLPQALNILNRV